MNTPHLLPAYSESKMSTSTADAVRKIRLKVECPLIEETSLQFNKSTNTLIETGAYGKVMRAVYDEKKVAVKYFRSAEEKRGYKQELVFLSCLQKHDNIVILFGTGAAKASKEPYIVMEFAPYSLERVLHGSYPRYGYGADHVMHWSRQTAVGLNYIHSKRILHRDIKASNLLLFGNGSHLKLCDFGTCRNLETNLLYTASIGTVRYMSPEVIQGESYTTKCDIFSFAITLWEMLARKVPTIDVSAAQLNSYAILFQMVQGKRPPLLSDVPVFINELLMRCWHQDPTARLSSAELVGKLTRACEYFEYGHPLYYEETDPLGEDDQYELTTTGSTLSESMATSEVIETATSVVETSGSSVLFRTQSDMSFMHQASDRNKVPSEVSLPPGTVYSQTPSVEVPFESKEHFQHGYPPRDSYTPPKRNSHHEGFSSFTTEGTVAVVDHEVHEVVDPHSEDMKYASLDENRLRFDVQCQYLQIEQAYQKPSSLPSKPLVRNKKPVHDVAPMSTDKSKYTVPGLSPHLQPVTPDENDPESLQMYEQFMKLSAQLQNS